MQALRAKGLSEWGVFKHVVKNAAPTALAVMGLQLGYLLGGSILIETVFAWPGTGFLLNAAIFQRDLPLLQGTILVLAMFFVCLNLVVDVLQTALDPRIQRALSMTAIADAGDRRPPSWRARGYWASVGAPARARPGRDGRARASSLLIVLAAIFAPWIAPADPYRGIDAAAAAADRLRPAIRSAPTSSAATCSRA